MSSDKFMTCRIAADEVRNLADRTAEATREIGEKIEHIRQITQTAIQSMEAGTQRRTGAEKIFKAGSALPGNYGRVTWLTGK